MDFWAFKKGVNGDEHQGSSGDKQGCKPQKMRNQTADNRADHKRELVQGKEHAHFPALLNLRGSGGHGHFSVVGRPKKRFLQGKQQRRREEKPRLRFYGKQGYPVENVEKVRNENSVFVAEPAGEFRPERNQHRIPDVDLHVIPQNLRYRVPKAVEVNRLENENQGQGETVDDGVPIHFLHLAIQVVRKIMGAIFEVEHKPYGLPPLLLPLDKGEKEWG